MCASNQNRSLEAHALLSSKHLDVGPWLAGVRAVGRLWGAHSPAGVQVHSYGTNAKVKLPGPAADRPNVFSFHTPYVQMHAELQQRDAQLYQRNGILAMLERNARVKHAPERWQECRCPLRRLPAAPCVPPRQGVCRQAFDCVITFEERVLHALAAGARPLLRPCCATVAPK